MLRTLAFALALSVVPAAARDDGQWSGSSPQIRTWFQHLMQPDNPAQSCCGEADAFEADDFESEGDVVVAIITDGKGVIENGTRIPVPNKKVKWQSGNPTGHGILFLSGLMKLSLIREDQGFVIVDFGEAGARLLYCYVLPSGT